jgi:hypothetical protein
VHVLQDQGGGLFETLCPLGVLPSSPINTFRMIIPGYPSRIHDTHHSTSRIVDQLEPHSGTPS